MSHLSSKQWWSLPPSTTGKAEKAGVSARNRFDGIWPSFLPGWGLSQHRLLLLDPSTVADLSRGGDLVLSLLVLGFVFLPGKRGVLFKYSISRVLSWLIHKTSCSGCQQ